MAKMTYATQIHYQEDDWRCVDFYFQIPAKTGENKCKYFCKKLVGLCMSRDLWVLRLSVGAQWHNQSVASLHGPSRLQHRHICAGLDGAQWRNTNDIDNMNELKKFIYRFSELFFS